jgi:hypothetical protein
VSLIVMEFPRPLPPKSTFALILQVGIFNALLATLMAAAAYALVSGAWIERRSTTVGIGAAQKVESSLHLTTWELTKAILWLSPFAVVSCGWFGLLAGLIGGAFMCLRGPRVTSRRLLIETSILGLPLACLFPFCDTWVNGRGGIGLPYPAALYLLAVVLGPVCAFICALAFRQRCRLRWLVSEAREMR